MASSRMISFADRVRHARLECGFSQTELARAISHISKTKTSKALISQWELGKINNPQNPTVLALAAATGFSLNWLITGKGPEKDPTPNLVAGKASAKYAPGLDRETLRRSILIACEEQTDPAAIAEAAIEVFETLADEPDVPQGALKRIARMVQVKP